MTIPKRRAPMNQFDTLPSAIQHLLTHGYMPKRGRGRNSGTCEAFRLLRGGEPLEALWRTLGAEALEWCRAHPVQPEDPVLLNGRDELVVKITRVGIGVDVDVVRPGAPRFGVYGLLAHARRSTERRNGEDARD